MASRPYAEFFNDERFSDRVLLLVRRATPPAAPECKSQASSRIPRPESKIVRALDDETSDDETVEGQQRAPASQFAMDEAEDRERTQASPPPASPSELRVVKKIHVNSLVLAADSPFFKALLTNGMKESTEKEIHFEVADEEEAERVATLIRFLYTGDLRHYTSTADRPQLLLLADRLGIGRAVEAVSKLLAEETDLTIERCSGYLELSDLLSVPELCKDLVARARLSLAQEFKNLDATWESDRFFQLSLRAVVAVLGSDSIEVRSENTVFQAARAWFQRNGQGSYQAYAALLQCIRFPMLSRNFALDVAFKLRPLFLLAPTSRADREKHREREFMQCKYRELSEQRVIWEVQDRLDFLIEEATEWMLSEGSAVERQKQLQILTGPASTTAKEAAESAVVGPLNPLRFTPRPGSTREYQMVYDWRLEKASRLGDAYQFSPRFMLDGYYFLLGAGRVMRADGEHTLGLYLYLDMNKTGVCNDRLFLRGEYELGATTRSGTYVPLWNGRPIYSKAEIGLGRHDLFSKRWQELFADSAAGLPSAFVDSNDNILFTVKVRIVESR